MKKPIEWDFLLFIFAGLMLGPVYMGLGMASMDIGGGSIEIREFNKQEHFDIMISTFQLDLAPNETFYVERFRRGAGQGEPVLNIAIEGIQSVDDFISRCNDNISEIDVVKYPDVLGYREQLGAFKLYYVNLSDFGYELVFYQNEDGITARLDLGDRALRSLVDVRSILAEYFPSIWLHPFALVPLAIQAGLILCMIVRAVRRRTHKKHNEKPLKNTSTLP